MHEILIPKHAHFLRHGVESPTLRTIFCGLISIFIHHITLRFSRTQFFSLYLHAHVVLVIDNEELFSQTKEDHHERKAKKKNEKRQSLR